MHNGAIKHYDQTQQKGIIQKLFTVLMSVILVVGLMPTFSFAQDASAEDASDVSAWDGTTVTAVSDLVVEDGVYQINSAADLAGFRDGINNYTIYDENDENTTIPLSADAQLNVDCDMSVTDWTPIALTVDSDYGMSADISYTGTFDGANHTIKIESNTESTNSKTSYMGLFAGIATSGVVKNLTLEGSFELTKNSSSQVVYSYVGAFVSMSYGATITECVNKMDVTANGGTAMAGGFVAWDRGSTIVNCGNEGTIIATTASASNYMPHAGGICAYWYANTADYGGRSCIENCYNWGDISASGGGSIPSGASSAGGIVGYAQSATGNSGYLVNCYSSGEIAAEPYEGASYSYAGALLGWLAEGYLTSSTQLYVDNCYWAQGDLRTTGNEVTSSYFHENDTGIYSDAATLLTLLQKVKESPAGASGLGYVKWVASDNNGLPYFGDSVSSTPVEVTLDGNDGTFTVETEIEPETDTWNGTSYTEPDLEDDVYQINSAANLAWFVAYVNGTGEAGTTSTHYSANAVLNIDVVWNYLWMPIGYYRGSQSRTNSFTGTFDGNGHTVTINSDIIPTDVDSGIGAVTFNWGFISVLGQGGVVKDLTIDGKLTVTSANGDNSNSLYVGGIAGDVYYGSAVTGCVNKADITATTDSKGVYVGGITGEIHGDPTIVNCGNEGTISGETKGTSSGNCYALVGGIAGDVYPYVSSSFGTNGIVCLENCYNWGNVSATTAAAATTGAGGIAGRSFTTFNYSQDTTTTINNCYSTGTFEASNTDSSKLGAGAIIGYLYTSSTCTTTLSNCYWAPSLGVSLPYGLLSGNDNLTVTNAAAYADAGRLLDTLNEQADSTGASGIVYDAWKADEANDDLPYFGSRSMGLAEVPSIKITVGTDGMIAEGDYAEPHLEGYTFAGWNTKPDGSGTSYTREELLEVVFGEDTTIYAMWDEIKTTFDVTLDGNGGVFAGTTDDTLVLTTDESGYLVGDIPEPTREGYAFTGWARGEDGTDPIDDIHAVQFTQDTEVYAQWDAIEYTIEVNTVGDGTVVVTVDGVEATTEPIKATIDQPIEVTVTPADGYEITSVTINYAVDGRIYSGTDSTYTFSMPASDVAIDVVFSAIPLPEYQIEVETDGHGTVTIGYEEATAGEPINFSVIAYDGYEIADVVITDMSGNDISDQVSLDSDGEGNYMFVMPDFAVDVVVTFKEITVEPEPDPDPEPEPDPEPTPEPDPEPTPEPTGTEITPNMFIVDTINEVYTGEPIEKTIASTLVEGVDYEVTYTDNVDAGTATITITGIGDYEGELTYEFTIERAFVRLAGDDRYGTMEEIDDAAFESADTVVLAAGSNFPDALAAAGLAGTLDAPIVLTATDALSDEAAEEIVRLGASNVVIVGGENSVSAAVVQELTAMGVSVMRVSGADRYETAVEAYYAGLGSWGTSGNGTAKTAIIAAGTSFADTLSASSYAWWATAPIFLASSGGLDEATKTAITSGGFERIIIVGGVNSVPASVEVWAYEVASTKRLAGDDRYDTSVAFATWAAGEGMSFNNAGIATGKNFPDALAGGALCGQRGSVLLLADCEGGTQAVDLLVEHKDEISRVYYLGGENSVTSELTYMIESSLS